MAYDDVKLLTVTFPSWDWGDGATTDNVSFRLPTTHPARLVQIGVMVQETFDWTSTPANVQLGTAADPDAYAELQIGSTSADLEFYDQTQDTDAIIAAAIAANTLLEVTCQNGANASTAGGKGILMLTFEIHSGE